MSKTRGEGRSSSEKAGRVVETPDASKRRRLKREQEEAEWAARSGPVNIRKKEVTSGATPPSEGGA